MLIKISDFGSSLCTRSSGREVYETISFKMESAKERIVFDFDGVSSITHSFADEVFGRLSFDLGIDVLKTRTSFINISPFSARVIRMAMNKRDSTRYVDA